MTYDHISLVIIEQFNKSKYLIMFPKHSKVFIKWFGMF